ncbi:MAG: cupin [Deltaproteobacteria bacterium GWA2_38_16]|nr:MAG: cupin [Deltaproteobacteria bacterium GWA2_38_16]OGQ03194.1 MAG: cupin [Deltaproteobacteria bacterium RIFCSPHIGHO2_02_FULL_38_15]OGQ34669.1 MAG: cupin [Deltaproteobacteria bacterium RIFCSPLOWO2_01_FULL_38_9]HBQ20380.1 cupin [Deltaproteobacteria bacterium]
MKKIDKPWGYELLFAKTKHYAGKILFVRKGESLSLQYHRKKEESMYVYRGKLNVWVNGKLRVMTPGKTLHLPPKTMHRVKALADSEIFEVSTPHLEDVVRLEDCYGRI